jgi:GNAT superfamily N-acetyltransferase
MSGERLAMVRRRVGSPLLRSARPGDAAGIARVHVEAWRTTYAGSLPGAFLRGLSVPEHTARWTRMLRPGGDTVLVIEDGEAGIVGFGSAGPARQAEMPVGDWQGEIYTLYLLTDWQGRGLGRALIHGLFDRLVDAGMERIALWVVAANPTRFFYEAMGGRAVARRCEPFAGIMLDEIAYGWRFDLAHGDAA